MKFAAALSTFDDASAAARDVLGQAFDQLGAAPHLAMAFASTHHRDRFGQLARDLHAGLSGCPLLGCTGESIVCGSREIEGGPALALWVAHLPAVEIWPMHLDFHRTPDGGALVGWPDDLPESWPAGSALFAIGEPFTFPAELLLDQINQAQPGVAIIGGMASGGHAPGENRLIFGSREITRGAVAVLMHGALRVRTVVSQGCRPIGRPLVVTKAEENVIYQLGGRSALARLQETFADLSAEEQSLARQGLHLGQVINEYQERFARGDFLVRNLQGADPDSGAIAIGDLVRVGQTVQFHVRDVDTADEELNSLLDSAQQDSTSPPLAALMFTCNGRGTRLFNEPDHDARAVRRALGPIPLAGFFAQGEMGPVGGKNFLHGFTASIALLQPADGDAA